MSEQLSASILGTGVVHSCGNWTDLQEACEAQLAFTPTSSPQVQALNQYHSLRDLRRIPKYAQLALLAAQNAYAEACLKTQPPKTERIALVLGSAHTAVQMSFDFIDSILEFGAKLSSPTAFSHAVNNMGAGLVSLLMGLRGSCQTITQWELSFAGALTTAITLLATKRADWVLVGAVEELDPRFTQVCTTISQEHDYTSEGAIFFCLQSPRFAPYLDLPIWHKPPGLASISSPVFLSGTAKNLNISGIDNSLYYGKTPLAQALDTGLMLHYLSKYYLEQGQCCCAIKQQIVTIPVRR